MDIPLKTWNKIMMLEIYFMEMDIFKRLAITFLNNDLTPQINSKTINHWILKVDSSWKIKMHSIKQTVNDKVWTLIEIKEYSMDCQQIQIGMKNQMFKVLKLIDLQIFQELQKSKKILWCYQKLRQGLPVNDLWLKFL